MSYELAKRFNDPLLKPWCASGGAPCLPPHGAAAALPRPTRTRVPASPSLPNRVNANADAEGYCDERPGLKHFSVRSSGRDSAAGSWRPAAGNVAPRAAGWRPAPSPARGSSAAQ